MLKYTICFIQHNDSILMLYRHRPPNASLWNGIGGKLEDGESPLAGMYREVAEEAAIALEEAEEVRFAGVVTWPRGGAYSEASEGMYAFIARLHDLYIPWTDDRTIPEGVLSWKPMEWVCNPQNDLVVENIPLFLPRMLEGGDQIHVHCNYADGSLLGMDIRPLERKPGINTDFE